MTAIQVLITSDTSERKNGNVLRRPNRRCYLCGRNGLEDPLDKHHIFGGANRSLSEKYGAYVWLCHNRCHIFGKEAVHQNAATMQRLHEEGQRMVMENHNLSIDEFRHIFGRNYLDTEVLPQCMENSAQNVQNTSLEDDFKADGAPKGFTSI